MKCQLAVCHVAVSNGFHKTVSTSCDKFSQVFLTLASGCPYRGLIMRADVSLFEQFVIISLVQILLAAALTEMMVYPAVAHELAVIVMVSSGGRCRGVRPDIRVVGSGRICHSGPSLSDGGFFAYHIAVACIVVFHLFVRQRLFPLEFYGVERLAMVATIWDGVWV